MQAARGASLTSDHRSALRLLLGVAGTAWVLDQVTKAAAEHGLDGRAPVEILGPLLRLTLVHNAGAAFSTGETLTLFISLFALVALAVVSFLALRVAHTGWAWALGLLMAGITGNLTDRIFRDPGPLRGHVVDFMQLPHWPVFNFADIWIDAAAVLIVVLSMRGIRLDGRRIEDVDTTAGARAEEDAGEAGRVAEAEE